MERDRLLHMYMEMNDLLELEAATEDMWQQWFERFPEIFELLGFPAAIAHPRLDDGPDTYIPDFLVQTADGFWRIFEIKAAKEQVLIKRERRRTFTAAVHSYIAQCREYNAFFDDKINRSSFERTYGIAVQKSVSPILVVGGKLDEDRHQIHALAHDNRIEVRSFMDISQEITNKVKKKILLAESQDGLSVSMIFRPRQMAGAANHVFEIGVAEARNSVSFIIDHDGNFLIRIFDSDGDPFNVSVSMKHAGVSWNQPINIIINVGMTGGNLATVMYINGECVVEHLGKFARLDMPDMDIVIGTDAAAQAASDFDLGILAVVHRTLDIDQLLIMLRYLNQQTPIGRGEAGDPKFYRLEFRNGAYLYTKNHRTLSLSRFPKARDLVQERDERRPILRA